MADVAALAARWRPKAALFIIGVTGSVAAGKTTFALALASQLRILAGKPRVEIVCTDGFLFPNAVLEGRALLGRKGFPETYDSEALRAALVGARAGPVAFPGYSHESYDIDPVLTRTFSPPEILIVEGLSLDLDRGDRADNPRVLDLLIYLDAEEADIEAWFTSRFLELCQQAKDEPASFYARFSPLPQGERRAVAAWVWREINLPNLREHIARAKSGADILIRKSANHDIQAVTPRLPSAAGAVAKVNGG